MDLTALPLIGPLVQLGTEGLALLIRAFEPFFGVAAGVAAIALITLVVRAFLIPLDVRIVRAEGARRTLAPQLAELRRRWRGRPEELQRRTLQLYRDAGVSPVAGMGTMLAQAPIVSLLYLGLASPLIAGEANPVQRQALWGVSFGEPLGAAALTLDPGSLALAVTVVALLTVAGFLQRSALRRLAAGLEAPEMPVAAARLVGVLPFVAVIPALLVPFGAAVYLVVSSLWTALERPLLRRILWGEEEWRPTR